MRYFSLIFEPYLTLFNSNSFASVQKFEPCAASTGYFSLPACTKITQKSLCLFDNRIYFPTKIHAVKEGPFVLNHELTQLFLQVLAKPDFVRQQSKYKPITNKQGLK